MITDAIIKIILNPILSVLRLMPVVSADFNIPDNVATTIRSIYGLCAYILPMPTIITCLGIMLSFQIFKIIMALIVRVKSFIPTMGA